MIDSLQTTLKKAIETDVSIALDRVMLSIGA